MMKKGRKKMDRTCSPLTALAAGDESHPMGKGSCKAFSFPSHLTHLSANPRWRVTFWKKRPREVGSGLLTPKLIPWPTSPIHYCHCFFINQVRQTQRLEHSGSVYSKHRNINMKTTDPGTITGWEIFIFHSQRGLCTLFCFLEILSA